MISLIGSSEFDLKTKKILCMTNSILYPIEMLTRANSEGAIGAIAPTILQFKVSKKDFFAYVYKLQYCKYKRVPRLGYIFNYSPF